MTNRGRSERIFLTAKARIVAEDRARELNEFLNLLTAWYSFWLIAVAVANLTGSLTHTIVAFSATLVSIALCGLSLYLLGGKITQNADEHRRCYLALKSIYHSGQTDEEKMALYDAELNRYANHKTIDYDLMVCEADERGQQLWNEEGTIVATAEMRDRVKKYKAKRTRYSVLLALLPIILIGAAVALAAQTDMVLAPSASHAGTR